MLVTIRTADIKAVAVNLRTEYVELQVISWAGYASR